MDYMDWGQLAYDRPDFRSPEQVRDYSLRYASQETKGTPATKAGGKTKPGHLHIELTRPSSTVSFAIGLVILLWGCTGAFDPDYDPPHDGYIYLIAIAAGGAWVFQGLVVFLSGRLLQRDALSSRFRAVLRLARAVGLGVLVLQRLVLWSLFGLLWIASHGSG